MRGSCLALIACLLVGCGGSDAGDKPDPQAESPRLGGVPPTATPPAAPMDEVEKPIARKLEAQVATQGLRVDHLA
ncbi:MAG: hypothetical protein M3144_04225, partial [Actinomycetota bacterium]|nr:hypothetical protein [Actinomycetota bacterium]